MTDCLIDSGNTRVKFARRKRDQWQFIAAVDFEHPQFVAQCLNILNAEPFEKLYMACVSKGARAEKLQHLLLQYVGPIIRIAPLPVLGRLQIAYPIPAQLGVDRFLAMLAAVDEHVPSIVISFGSAITIDVLSADGVHQGGLIAPSPEFQWRAMHDYFPGLFQERPGNAQNLANNTSDALATGIQQQLLGMIDRVIAENSKAANTRILITGGAAEAWLAKLPSASIYSPDILFNGMHKYIALSGL
jgi:type III pantothenate kinase